MSVPVRPLLAALVVTALLVVAGVLVLGGDDDPPATAPEPEVPVSTPLASYDTSTVTVTRAAFCDAVPAASAEEALGGAVEAAFGYVNGQRADVTGKVDDVAHEFSCTWKGTDGATARAWVFAPPVTADRAQALATAAETAPGCARTDGPAYGTPSTAVVCTSSGQVLASYRGLFGDAWLTCAVSVPDPAADPTALLDSTGRWCVAVAQAASGAAADGGAAVG